MGIYFKDDDKTLKELYLELEDINYHTENVVLQAIADGDYDDIVEACKILVEHNEKGHLTAELEARRHKLLEKIYGE